MKHKIAAIHINKTGRICFNPEAREHMGVPKFMKVELDGNLIRLEPTHVLRLSYLKGSAPYISEGQTLPFLKPRGFDGSRSYDINPKFLTNGGFEFRLD